MNIIDINLDQLIEAKWNSNVMDQAMFNHLRSIIRRYGLLGNLVVRRLDACFEVLSGNHRLRILKELGLSPVPCVVVEANDAQARLLAQALNHIHGEDDLGIRAENVREMLKSLPATEVLAIIPESATSLKALAELGKQPVADYLRNWQESKSARLRHLQFQLADSQLAVVEAALNRLMPISKVSGFGNPNTRGNALFLLCQSFLEREEKDK